MVDGAIVGGRSVLIVLLADTEMLLPEPMLALAGLGFGASAPIGARLSEFPRYLGLPTLNGPAFDPVEYTPTVCILIVSHGVNRMGGISAVHLTICLKPPYRFLQEVGAEESCLRPGSKQAVFGELWHIALGQLSRGLHGVGRGLNSIGAFVSWGRSRFHIQY